MTAKPHTCITIECDACGEQMQDDLILHFTSIDEARSASGHHEWFIAEDGRALCPGRPNLAAHNRLASEWLPTLSDAEREELADVYPWFAEGYYADDDEPAIALS